VLGRDDVRVDGAVLPGEGMLLRFFGGPAGDRLLLLNLGSDLDLSPAPEPLLAPPLDQHWALRWSSESMRYGGRGTPDMRPHEEWHMPGECAVLFGSEQGAIDRGDDGAGTDAGD
jgi:maltooligosyltrehalose trehalohydrolase